MFSNFNATDNIVSAAAYIFAKDTDGSYLILCGRRSGSDPRHQGGYYDVPVGMREMGETPQQTARRETLEETGIAIPLNMFRFIEKQTWGGGRAGSNFLVILDKPLRIGQGDTEHDDTRWLPVDKVHTLRWAYGMDAVIDRYYGQFITNNTQGRKTTMTEKQLSRLISETISNVISEGHYELYGYGTNYPKIRQHAIDTNATDLEDYDNQEREALKILRQKGEVGQNHHPQATVYNNGENTPVSNASIDASFYKYGDNSDQILANMRENKDANCKKISRRQLNKLISESIVKVIKEGRINDPDGSLAMMNAGDFMIRMGANEIQSGQNDGIDAQHMLSQRGAQVLERGRDVCNWIIDVDGRSFCSRHNFSNERQAEKNANKYIKFLERKLKCQVEAYIEGIFKADDEEADIMGCEPGAVTCDTLLTYSSDLGFWMD